MAKQNEPIGPGSRPPMPNMKRGVGQFIKEVGIEMRKVIWPSRAETFRLTSAVLLVCVLFVVYLWVAGYVMDAGVKLLEGERVF
jgi:preprotein translocase subunit SecE